MIGRLLRWVLGFVAVAALLLLFVCQATRNVRRPPPAARQVAASSPRAAPTCHPAPAFAAAAARNAAGLLAAPVLAFGRAETGWETYAPLAAREIESVCPPSADGFAADLARWQGEHGLPASGVMDSGTLRALDLIWLARRPFAKATSGGACPPPPQNLADAEPTDGYQGKAIRLRPGALAAWRAMSTAAKAETPAIASDPRLLTIFSGFRDPALDAARCAADRNCGTSARANCSAHRTGLAVDLFLGAAPGFDPASSADANRVFQSRTPAYRWLVANASRFGFVPYPFEPWHWEWTGEPP